MGEILKGHRVVTSSLNIPILRKHYTKCFPLFSFAVNSLKLQDDYDLLISSESGPIKGISKPKELPQPKPEEKPSLNPEDDVEDDKNLQENIKRIKSLMLF